MDPVVRHHLQQGQGGVQIVAVIGQGLLHGLAHGLVSGQVHRRGDVMGPEHPVQGLPVRHVHPIEHRGPAGDFFDALRHVRAAVGQVVGDDHVIVPLQQLHRDVGPDEPGSTGKQNSLFHGTILPISANYWAAWRTTAENRYTPVPSYNGAVSCWARPL